MTTPADVIAQAAKWVGFVEAPVNRTPFGRWYGMDGQPYCAMALSYWTFHAGLPTPASTPKGYAYTPSGANWFRARNRWGTTPRVGAHVFFRFSGDRIHHVGLVTAVNRDGTIDTIEANTSAGSAGSQRDGGGVWRRRRGPAGIVGYGYPDYSAGPGPAPTPTEEDDLMFDTGTIPPAGARWAPTDEHPEGLPADRDTICVDMPALLRGGKWVWLTVSPTGPPGRTTGRDFEVYIEGGGKFFGPGAVKGRGAERWGRELPAEAAMVHIVNNGDGPLGWSIAATPRPR